MNDTGGGEREPSVSRCSRISMRVLGHVGITWTLHTWGNHKNTVLLFNSQGYYTAKPSHGGVCLQSHLLKMPVQEDFLTPGASGQLEKHTERRSFKNRQLINQTNK